MSGFQLQRLGQIMEPEPGNPREVESVLNPAVVRGPEGLIKSLVHRIAERGRSRLMEEPQTK